MLIEIRVQCVEIRCSGVFFEGFPNSDGGYFQQLTITNLMSITFKVRAAKSPRFSYVDFQSYEMPKHGGTEVRDSERCRWKGAGRRSAHGDSVGFAK
ncbi:unnamed protein product [Calypogeia fissa]